MAQTAEIKPYTGDKKALKPFLLWSHASGPNPWKVAMILAELGLPYENKFIRFPEMKEAEYESVNPNGRVPALYDPNTSLTLWESGAIISYILSTYDTAHQLHAPPTSPDHWHEQQYLHFQMSGQGPYYGQGVWFQRYHPDKSPSAIARYRNEIRRVIGVLERALRDAPAALDGSPDKWLVGGRCSYADLVFLMWDARAEWILAMDEDEAGESERLKATYPLWFGWRERISNREAVKKVVEERKVAIKEHPAI